MQQETAEKATSRNEELESIVRDFQQLNQVSGILVVVCKGWLRDSLSTIRKLTHMLEYEYITTAQITS